MRGCGLLRPDEQQRVVGCDCCPNGFRPLLAAVETVLVTPDGDAMRHKVLQEWLQDGQVTARIAEEDLGHDDSEMPRASYRTVISLRPESKKKKGTKVK